MEIIAIVIYVFWFAWFVGSAPDEPKQDIEAEMKEYIDRRERERAEKESEYEEPWS